MAEQYAHLTPLASLLRVYKTKDDFLNKKPYQSVMSVAHSSPDTVVLTGAKGGMSNGTIEAVADSLIDIDVSIVYLDRADGHVFPYGTIEYEKDGVTRYKLDISSGLRSARISQTEQQKGESMKALADSNIGSNVTTINDKDGNLLVKFTREYGESLPTAEVIQIEAALLELAAKLQAA